MPEQKKNRNNFEIFRALREFVFQYLKSPSLRSLQKATVVSNKYGTPEDVCSNSKKVNAR